MKDIDTHKLDDLTSRSDGLTVPDGYFADFAKQMAARLPYREELDVPVAKQKTPKNNFWLRVRPYVYMAAMFAGAWCLIKMFSIMSPSTSPVNIDNYPSLSLALEDEQFVDEYIIDGVSTYDVVEDSYYNSLGLDPDSEYDENGNLIETDDEAGLAAETATPGVEDRDYRLPGEDNSTVD